MTGFSEAIAAELLDDRTDHQSLRADDSALVTTAYRINIDRRWGIGGRPNGGYLLAAIANAGRSAITTASGEHTDALAANAQFLRPPAPGPAEILVTVLRRGRSSSQVQIELHQNGQLCVVALINFGDLSTDSQPWWTDGDTIELPAEQDCVELPANPPGGDFEVPMMEFVSQRLDPSVLGFAVGEPTNKGELRGWLRFRDDRPLDALALLFVVDSFPPAVFDLGSMGWVPTHQLSVYVRALPAPGPLQVRQRARLVEAGTVDEVCDVWDSAGRLVAQGTQLAGFRPAK
ncbi:MAG: thioesterase family protein [Candidatus Nanopelagicales bacterium]